MRAAWNRHFRTGVIELPIQVIALLCREMKWDYETYLAQPNEFIQILFELLRAEAEHRNKAAV